MNILVDCRTLIGDKEGIGFYMENLLYSLAKIDAQNEYTLCYVSGRAEESQFARIPYPNFRTKVIRFPNQAFNWVMRDSALPHRIMRSLSHGYDLVHEPCFEPLPLAPRLVLTLHDVVHLRLPEHFPPAVVRAQWRRFRESTCHASHIMADSEFTKREAMELLGVPADKIHTVYLGVDGTKFADDIPEAEGQRQLKALGIDRPFLLSIGAFGWRKNFLTALKAFARLQAPLGEQYQYVIAGTQRLPEVTAQMVAEIEAAGLQGRVVMPGYIDQGTRKLLMHRAAALVYPSLYEGFGLPPLEAMACGTPVVAAESSSIPEVVGDAGLLVPDYLEPDAWAQAISRILTDDQLRESCITRGRERVLLFPWERTARETLKVYELTARSAV